MASWTKVALAFQPVPAWMRVPYPLNGLILLHLNNSSIVTVSLVQGKFRLRLGWYGLYGLYGLVRTSVPCSP